MSNKNETNNSVNRTGDNLVKSSSLGRESVSQLEVPGRHQTIIENINTEQGSDNTFQMTLRSSKRLNLNSDTKTLQYMNFNTNLFNCRVLLKDINIARGKNSNTNISANNNLITNISSLDKFKCAVLLEDINTNNSNFDNPVVKDFSTLIRKCGSKRCKFQNKFSPTKLVFSSATQRSYDCIVPKNFIYLTDKVELLGIIIDNKLSFSNHISRLCKYANNKLYAIIRMRKYLSTSQTKLLVNSYVLSYFAYCPLLWMFCYKKEMSLINRTHKRALRTIYNNFNLELDELLLMDNSCNIHTKHLRTLMVEIYKTLNKDNPELMWKIFETKSINYSLRNKMRLVLIIIL